MLSNNDQLTLPIEAIVFDCDGTMSHIEGIDELANDNGVGEQVRKLTATAMGLSGLNPQLYSQRLNLVLPSFQQVLSLAQRYFQHISPDLPAVLAVLKAFNKHIYIVSAGISLAVTGFGELLDIKHENIFAVDVFFDEKGQYVNFDHQSPLIHTQGKRQIVEKIKKRHERIAFIGDGLNDLSVKDLVTRFIGYGGAFYRKNIEENCQFYISSPSIAPLIELCLTENEKLQLAADGITHA